MTGQPATRTVRRDTLLEKMRAQGHESADRDARRIKAETGLDMFPRGQALVDYVTRELCGPKTAEQIAQAVGYTVPRCAQKLAECRNAPLARDLIQRARFDQAFEVVIVVTPAPKPKPEPEPVRTSRPSPTADEILWELEDASVRGSSFDAVADLFGMLPASLRRRIERLGIVTEARAIFAALGYRPKGKPAERKPTGLLCSKGHLLFANPGKRPRCRECNRRHKAQHKARVA